MAKLIVLDVETSGLDPRTHEVVQLAACVHGEGEPVEYQTLIKPEGEMDEQAVATHGITMEMLKDAPSQGQAYRDFQRFLGKFVNKYNKKDKLHFIGYNALFDASFVRAWFERQGDPYFGSWFWWPPIDLMTVAGFMLAHKRHTMPDFKLGTVCREMGIEVDSEKQHDAMYDVQLTARLFMALHMELKEPDNVA